MTASALSAELHSQPLFLYHSLNELAYSFMHAGDLMQGFNMPDKSPTTELLEFNCFSVCAN